MIDRVTTRLYGRLGCRYWWVLVAGQTAVSTFVALLTTMVIASYYDPAAWQAAAVVGTGCACTIVASVWAGLRARPDFVRALAWRDEPAPTPAETVAVWDAMTTLVFRQYRRDSLRVTAIAVVPTSVVGVVLLGLPWWGLGVIIVACLIPAGYATVMSYTVGEWLGRPVVAEIAAALPDDFPLERHGLPVHKRILLGVPAYTAATGLVVATILGDRDGSADLVVAVVVSLAVGLALSQELSTLFSRSITTPIADVRRALAEVRAGDLTARVPVLTSDELGELALDFNRMARGLEEREELRTAFGTYMDKAVAEIILSGQFPPSGLEVDVSIMFVDVRGFTSYVESAEAREVIAAINRLFETMVPIVDRHGGHVDKFIGDGLLAVFGAPEFFPDHADRAVAAACEIVAAVNAGDTGLTVGAGVNTGRVVAGSVGGAGRLNFTVIGDAVNVAARVEAATRTTGDDVLMTATTRHRLAPGRAVVSRGEVPLKGKAEPVEVFAPVAEVGEALVESVS